MANFSFLADKAEFRAFAKDCIDAEEALQNSFDSCVKLVRTAVDAAVKWVYAHDKNFSFIITLHKNYIFFLTDCQ